MLNSPSGQDLKKKIILTTREAQFKMVPIHFPGGGHGLCDIDCISYRVPVYLKIWGWYHISSLKTQK